MAFNEQKVAQMAAFFLSRNGGALSIIKLMKLLYLADRKSLETYEMPMSGDRMVSMPHGPVLSRTLELMNGAAFSQENGWECWIADRAGHMLSLRDCHGASFDRLSEADIELLEVVQREFGAMDQWALRDFTHDKCAEWTDPEGSSFPIEYKEVLEALGRPSEEARAIQEEIESHHSMDQLFARL